MLNLRSKTKLSTGTIVAFLTYFVLLWHHVLIPFKIPHLCSPSPKTTSHPPAIPNVVHFVHLGSTISFRRFIAIYSAYYYLRPNILYIHTTREDGNNGNITISPIPNSDDSYTLALQSLPNVVFTHQVAPTETSAGRKIERLAHKSDFIRTRVLKEWGGIYLDEDAYVVKDLKPLRHSGFKSIMGQQPDRTISNAIMMTVPEGDLITAFDLLQDSIFDGEWTTHSIKLLTRVVEDFSGKDDQVLALPPEAFCRIGWEETAVRGYYSHYITQQQKETSDPVFVSNDSANVNDYVANFNMNTEALDWRGSYVLHSWNSVLRNINDTQGIFGNDKGITLEYVLGKNSQFANVVYPVVKHALDTGVIKKASND